MAYNHILDNKYVIRDEIAFYRWFMATENKRISDSTPIMTTKAGEHRPYSSCNSTMSSDELTARYEYIVKDLQEVIGDIVFLKDENRLFSKSERYQLWEQQGGVCSVTGKIIPESEINDDSKWAADHIIPFSKGGQTALDNGQLIDKTSNLKKSNKLPIAA
jgi:5-methylcytosine-specific restriction endonuclease McrA